MNPTPVPAGIDSALEMKATALIDALKQRADPEKAKILSRFFKTGKGEYGEGDHFWGLTVPKTREVVRFYRGMALAEITQLLEHPVHEIRLAGWLLLVDSYQKADVNRQREIFEFYLTSTRQANNWDLVDLSAPQIVGDYLVKQGDWTLLKRLIGSANLWERRIAMVATLAFIKAGQFEPTCVLSEALLNDRHDLMHKASGWMLREMGKRGGESELRQFLEQHSAAMPRTMLRYAIERLEPEERRQWLQRDRSLRLKQKALPSSD